MYNFKRNDEEDNINIIENSDDDEETNNDLIKNWWFTGKVNDNENKIDVNDNYNSNEVSGDNDGFDIDYEAKTYKRKRNYNELKGNIINNLYDDEDEEKHLHISKLLLIYKNK